MRAFRAIPLLGGIAVIGVSLVAGMMLADEGSTAAIVAIPVPVQLPAPAVQAAPINVTVTAPAAPEPVVEAPQPIEYRATTPSIDTDCLGGGYQTADAAKPTCTWDSGFPAISADGSQIVEAHVPDDEGRGNPGLIVVFTDVATSKQVHSITVLDPDEIEFGKPPDARLRAKMRKRATAAQRLIDARKFRSLIGLGVHDAAYGEDAAVLGDPTTIHAEYVGDTMRLLDPATKTALWRHTFSAPSPWPKPDPDKECQSWYLAEVQTWWDPEKRVVLGRLFYHHGGCMCGSTSIPQVFRL